MSVELLADKLSSSFIVFENELNGETKTDLHRIRRESMELFEKKGFPSIRHEDWKYTSLKPVLKHDYKVFHKGDQALDFSDIKKFFIHDIDTHKIVFVNGVYSSWLSETTHQGYDVCTFSAALRRHRDVTDRYFSKAADNSSAMVALNTAFAQEGAYIRMTKGASAIKPVEIIHFTTEEAGSLLNQPRNLIVLEEGSDVQIIERHQSLGSKPVFTNSVSEIFVHANASLELYRVQNDANTASIVDHTSIQQHRDSRVRTAVFSLGGKLMRNDLNIAFLGENAEAHLDGLTLLDDGQHADHHTRVDHRVPHCNSFEMYKGIYDGNSKGVFNGQIMVRPHAQKTNAFQQNNNIILGEKASVDTKPQLEIFADDVKCSHGCTVGQLDDEALFYLRSRGIPEHEAKALLLYAIGDEVIGKVRLKELRNRLHKLMAKKLNVDFQMEI